MTYRQMLNFVGIATGLTKVQLEAMPEDDIQIAKDAGVKAILKWLVLRLLIKETKDNEQSN